MRPWLADVLRCPWSGGPLTCEVIEAGDDGVRHGLLHGEAGTFPVIEGIPVLRAGTGELVDLLRRGEADTALRRACFGEIPPSGVRRLGPMLAATERVAPLGRRLVDAHRRRVDEAAAAVGDPATSVHDLFDLAYRRLHLRNPEVFAYNWWRLGLPRHLTALGALAWAPRTGPVLDVGCGAGHLTWSVAGHVDPAPVVGVDGLFFALLVARTRLAPGAHVVCADLDALPFADDVFGGVWASDVVHALARKAPVARELDRVGRPAAWGVVTGLTVADHHHEYPGRPLSVDGYRRLLPDGATLVDDDRVLDAYLEGRAPDRGSDGAGPSSRLVTALWAGDEEAADGAAFAEPPHGVGTLVPNPLLARVGVDDTGARLALRFPTPAHEREHGALRRYTPETVTLGPEVVRAAARDERTPEVAALIDRFALLGAPPGYWPDAWDGLTRG